MTYPTATPEQIDFFHKHCWLVVEDVIPQEYLDELIQKSDDTGVRGQQDLLEIARHPDLLDVAEQIVGPDIIFWGSQVFSKPAGDGLAIP